jgi:hypothetical protein
MHVIYRATRVTAAEGAAVAGRHPERVILKSLLAIVGGHW